MISNSNVQRRRRTVDISFHRLLMPIYSTSKISQTSSRQQQKLTTNFGDDFLRHTFSSARAKILNDPASLLNRNLISFGACDMASYQSSTLPSETYVLSGEMCYNGSHSNLPKRVLNDVAMNF